MHIILLKSWKIFTINGCKGNRYDNTASIVAGYIFYLVSYTLVAEVDPYSFENYNFIIPFGMSSNLVVHSCLCLPICSYVHSWNKSTCKKVGAYHLIIRLLTVN